MRGTSKVLDQILSMPEFDYTYYVRELRISLRGRERVNGEWYDDYARNEWAHMQRLCPPGQVCGAELTDDERTQLLAVLLAGE